MGDFFSPKVYIFANKLFIQENDFPIIDHLK